jgi:hypothetical protein
MTSKKARRKALKKIGVDAAKKAAKQAASEVYIPAVLEQHMQDSDTAKLSQVGMVIWRVVGESIQKEQRNRQRRKRRKPG